MNPNITPNPNSNNPSTGNPYGTPAPAQSPTQPMNQTPPPAQPSVQPASPVAPKQTGKAILHEWYFWVIVVLAFFCIVSLVLAGYMLSSHSAMQAKINELNTTITEKDELIAKYSALIGQKVEDSSKPGYIDTSKTTTKDFIYVGEWGIKLYIPDGLEKVSYIFRNQIIAATEDLPAGEVESICVSGIPSGVTRIPEYFRAAEFISLGCLTRVPDNNLGIDTQKRSVYQDGTYYFFYDATKIDANYDAEESEWQTKAAGLVQELLTKNITKFQS